MNWIKKLWDRIRRKTIGIRYDGEIEVHKLKPGGYYLLVFPFPVTADMALQLTQRLERENIKSLIIIKAIPKGLENCQRG